MTEHGTNLLLFALDLKSTEKIISIKENKLADANFIISNLIWKFLLENNSKVCLVIFHNTLGHYQNIGKKLGYDLLQKIKCNDAIVIEPLKIIVETGFTQIEQTIFQDIQRFNFTHLIIDDISHLLDLGVNIKNVITFVNCCININNVTVVINCHVADSTDELISNHLKYVSNLNIEVSPLKTGRSRDVTGIIHITRRKFEEVQSQKKMFHYKAYDREIQVFAPGDSLHRLYK